MIGESGSGKSHFARSLVHESGGSMVRINRDDLRSMVHNNEVKSRKMEDFVIRLQETAAMLALESDMSVVIDDTNLNPTTQARWESIAVELGVEFMPYRMTTSLETCLERDSKRQGNARVGTAVIMRQFLESGRLPIDRGSPLVIVDVDGTLAHNDGHRSFYDETKVLLDKPIETVIKWVQELYKDHTVFIVSGRHSTCGEDTIGWLRRYEVPFHFIAMRHAWDNRDDCIVKKEILDAILKLVPKEQIKMAIDDRPKVIRMWKDNGLKAIPVAGACREF